MESIFLWPLIIFLFLLFVRVLFVRNVTSRDIFSEILILTISLLCGIFLGPKGMGLFTDHLNIQISPFLLFALGFQGLYWGLFSSVRDIEIFNKNLRRFAALHTFFIFTFMLAAGFNLLYFAGFQSWEVLIGGIVISLSLTQVSSASIRFLEKTQNYSYSFAVLFKAISGMSGLLTILLFGLLSPIGTTASLPSYILLLLMEIAVSVIMGFLVSYGLIKLRSHPEDYLIWLLGVLFLNSGFAYTFGFNPLFMNLITGTIISYRCENKQKIRETIKPLVRPVILFLLLYLGANINLHPFITPVIVPGALLIRYFLNQWSFRRFFTKAVIEAERIRPVLPLLMPLGALSPAIGVYLIMVSSSAYSGVIAGSLALAYIVSYTILLFLMKNEDNQWQ